MNSATIHLRLGTRGSTLARIQSQLVADALEKRHPGLQVDLVIRKTTGDQIQDRPLHEAGGKGLFTKELEQALLDREIDFAVHSFKDVPVTEPLVSQEDLVVAAIPVREDPRDVLISTGPARRIQDLPRGARIGTGSLRRRCQVLAVRDDLQVEMIRGNIDTRLRRLQEGRYDAIVLAMSGLRRSGLFDQASMHPITLDEMLPAAAQGALAFQCRRSDRRTRELLAGLDDPQSAICVEVERMLVDALDGDCHSPIGAYASLIGQQIRLQAIVGARGGELPVIRAERYGSLSDWNVVVRDVLDELVNQGARSLLSSSSSSSVNCAAER